MKDLNKHQAVMVTEVLKGLNIQPQSVYLDATFGRGGHARAILKELGQKGRLLAMDRDPTAIEAGLMLQREDPRLSLQLGPFSGLYQFCESQNLVGKVAGVLLDLGVSSPQLDNKERGFSFREEGPLDMRMDPTSGFSAAEWINQASEEEISKVLKEYGEERFHKRIARAIIAARSQAPITTTVQLAEIIKKANPAWEKHKHPATRSFQAIRIWVNNELNELSAGLEQGLAVLSPEGRLVVISFHSLEDRIVKQFIQKHERGDDHPRGLPVTFDKLNRKCRRIGRKTKPSDSEIAQNPRARSAVMRVAEKLEETCVFH